MLANGTQVNVSSTSYPDLFFAMRGAGSSFGIASAFTFATEPVPTNTVAYTYFWNFTASEATDAFTKFQTFVNSGIPAELGGEITLSKGPTPGHVLYLFTGAYYGNDFNASVQPYLAVMPSPYNIGLTNGDYIQNLGILANGQGLNTTGDAPEPSNRFYAKSLMVPESAPLDNTSISAFLTYLANEGYSTQSDWFVQMELYGGSNSAINQVPNNQTAFVQRDKLFNIQFYATDFSGPQYPTADISFVEGMVASLTGNEPSSWPFGAYVNYVDDQLTPSEANELYYGANYAPLSQLKSQYDPGNVFSFPTAIQ